MNTVPLYSVAIVDLELIFSIVWLQFLKAKVE